MQEYTVRCTQQDRSWTVRRRYRDFAQLNNDLSAFGLALGLPPKKLFGNLNPDFIAERQGKLQVSLLHLCNLTILIFQEFLRRVACHPFLYCSPMAAQFFELPEECLKSELASFFGVCACCRLTTSLFLFYCSSQRKL